jgi:hypothetical protein
MVDPSSQFGLVARSRQSLLRPLGIAAMFFYRAAASAVQTISVTSSLKVIDH